ncbi:MAG: SIS domain-containing protein, partial [Endomicrobia bacterium]|nr:SIS domain-containing protein [Endomicrobiia bacterium]
MSYMLKEIKQQPEVIPLTVEKNLVGAKRICEKIRKYNIRVIEFLARGSSDNACMFGRYFLGYLQGIPTGFLAPSLFSLYNTKKLNLQNVMIFGVSQSGETPEILTVLQKAKKYGAYTVGVTNNINSKIADIVDDILCLYAGEEKAVPATKTYTAQLAIFYLLGFIFENNTAMLKKFVNKVPRYITKVIDIEDQIAEVAQRYRFANNMIVLGRGLNFATALEHALKLKETCYIKAEAFSSSDFLHGPIAMVEQDLPIIVYAPKDATFPHLFSVTKRLKEEFNAEILAITTENKLLKFTDNIFKISKEVIPLFSPILYIVVGQLLCYYIAKYKK